MAGFKLRGHMQSGQSPAMVHWIIQNSATITLGDAVDINTAGGVQPADAGDYVWGIVVGLVTADGIDLKNAVSGDDYDGTYSGEQGHVGSETYVAASDNLTDKQIKAVLVVDPFALFYNDAAGDLAQADDGQFFDLTDEDQIADQNGHATSGAFQLIQRDPDGDGDASKGLFRMAEWQGYNRTQI